MDLGGSVYLPTDQNFKHGHLPVLHLLVFKNILDCVVNFCGSYLKKRIKCSMHKMMLNQFENR